MIPGANTVVRRYADALSRRGTTITLRRVSRVAGADAQPNPPTLVAPVLNGATAPGNLISIRASAAAGRIVAGDQLAIGALPPIAVLSTALATPPPGAPGFASVFLATSLPTEQADGTPIVPLWSADVPVRAMIAGFALHLLSDRIFATDLSVQIGAYNLAPPTLSDLLVIGADVRTIVAVVPTYVAGAVAKWTIQAR